MLCGNAIGDICMELYFTDDIHKHIPKVERFLHEEYQFIVFSETVFNRFIMSCCNLKLTQTTLTDLLV